MVEWELSHLVGSFDEFYITMHGSMNIKFGFDMGRIRSSLIGTAIDNMVNNCKYENCALPGSYAACSGNFVHEISEQNICRVFKFTSQNGAIVCLITSVRSYHCLLRNSPEEHGSRLLRSGSLKSRSCKNVEYAGV
jgi:hypothetical protein